MSKEEAVLFTQIMSVLIAIILNMMFMPMGGSFFWMPIFLYKKYKENRLNNNSKYIKCGHCNNKIKSHWISGCPKCQEPDEDIINIRLYDKIKTEIEEFIKVNNVKFLWGERIYSKWNNMYPIKAIGNPKEIKNHYLNKYGLCLN